MRSWLPPALVLSVAGCVAPAEAGRTCGDVKLERPLLVLERESSGQSGLGRVDVDGCLTEVPDIALGADPVLCPAHDRPFVCVRDEGLILEVDPSDAHIVRKAKAYRDGEPQPCGAATCANPYGVDVDAGGRLWVARYDQASVAVLQPGGAWAESIDLSALAGPTGMPQMDAVRIQGAHAFVALQRLPAIECVPPGIGPGAVAVVDVAAPHAVTSFALRGHNPMGPFAPDGSDSAGARVSIATPGSFADATSDTDGVELIDPDAGTSRVAVSERALGGSVIEALVVGPTEGYAIVAEADSPDCSRSVNATWLARFDPSTGRVTEPPLADTRTTASVGFYYAGLAVDGAFVVLGDRTPGAARLRFFDRESGASAGELASQLLPPSGLLTLP